MKNFFDKIQESFYSSKFYESFVDVQAKTVSKWQSYLLQKPLYWKWHSYKYSNTIHWGLLIGLFVGLIVGIMLPIAAPKSPGRSQEFELTPPSSIYSYIIISPNLLSTKDRSNTAKIEITLRDDDLNPIGGREVDLISTENNVNIETLQKETNPDGTFYAMISSTVAGTKEIMVEDLETGYILEKKAYVEFVDEKVLTWTKQGEIDSEAAATVVVPVDYAYKQWKVSAPASEALVEKYKEKKDLAKDSCVLIDQVIHCVGGLDSDGVASTNYYTSALSVEGTNDRAPLPIPVYDHEITTLNGKIYLAGGHTDEFVNNAVWSYSFLNNSWEKLNPMNEKRENYVLLVNQEKLYAVGGYNGTNQLNTVERYDGTNWENVTGMGTYRNFHAGAVWNDRIYIFGGWDGEKVLSTGEVYDVTKDAWYKLTDMPIARWAHTAITYQDKIYIIGGYDKDNKLISQIDVFDPSANSWTTSSAKFTVSESSLEVIEDGILIIGGNESADAIYKFIPEEFLISVGLNNNVRRGGLPSTEIKIAGFGDNPQSIVKNIDKLDLSVADKITLQLYSSIANPNVTFGFGELSGNENTFPVKIENKNLWTEFTVDISGIDKDKRDEVQYLEFIFNNSSEAYKLNIYDIWTENYFYTKCPCEKELSNIFFEKSDYENWSKASVSYQLGETSTIELSVREAGDYDTLSSSPWTKLEPSYDFSNLQGNVMEVQLKLHDDEDEYLPIVKSVSVVVK